MRSRHWPAPSRPSRHPTHAGSRPRRSGGGRPRWPAPRGRAPAGARACAPRAGWLVVVLNVLTGNLARPGGAMFTTAAAGASNVRGTPGKGKGMQGARWQSRVRGLPEALGELPVAGLAEEIDTPGEGQVRVLFTI